ncbi:MAG TPA: response regulator transcription factor [Pseudonocardia sp.]|jgi:DNA-binding response OmpR family regulator|nr:response regulator transcription factor [Pseudonocardia sp.]
MHALVIDDERSLAAGLAAGLEIEGFDVDIAYSGLEGLRRARERSYDIILLDVMLPGIDGYTVCRTLRAEHIWTPILMLTARDAELDELTGLDVGADDYLTKPFSYAVLVARMGALLRRGPGQQRETVLELGDLRLDPAAKRIWRGDTEISLTARELAVLEFLLRRAGEVVSKQQMLDHVWGIDFEGDTNIVEVYIRHLRNKVDRPFGRETIETYRGAGYRLVDRRGG